MWRTFVTCRVLGQYLMVWHSMGPGQKKTDANVNANCHIGVAWSDDLKTWSWRGKPADESLRAAGLALCGLAAVNAAQ